MCRVQCGDDNPGIYARRSWQSQGLRQEIKRNTLKSSQRASIRVWQDPGQAWFGCAIYMKKCYRAVKAIRQRISHMSCASAEWQVIDQLTILLCDSLLTFATMTSSLQNNNESSQVSSQGYGRQREEAYRAPPQSIQNTTAQPPRASQQAPGSAPSASQANGYTNGLPQASGNRCRYFKSYMYA